MATYFSTCLRCGRRIKRVRVKVARSGEPTHFEVGWRHVELIVDGRKNRCLRATPPSGFIEPDLKIRGKRGRLLKIYKRRKLGWEKEGEKNRNIAELKSRIKKARKAETTKRPTYKI